MTATMTREPAPAAQKAAGKKNPAEKKSLLKNKKVLILLVCVLAVAGAAYKMLMPSAPPGPPKPGDTVALDATTLNLADGHYLQIAVALQLVEGKATKDNFDTAQAADLLIDEFSNRSVVYLSTNANRDKLMGELQTKLKKAYPGEIYKVFKTKFVTQ
jgi:flagellar FliL protein